MRKREDERMAIAYCIPCIRFKVRLSGTRFGGLHLKERERAGDGAGKEARKEQRMDRWMGCHNLRALCTVWSGPYANELP